MEGKLVLAGLCLSLCALLSGCRATRYVEVPVEREHTEQRDRVVERVDTILVRDSVTVMARGDTVTIDRWHVREHVTHHRDTVRQVVRDSVTVAIPVEHRVEVERPLSRWQQTLMWTGAVALAAGALWIWITLRKRR